MQASDEDEQYKRLEVNHEYYIISTSTVSVFDLETHLFGSAWFTLPSASDGWLDMISGTPATNDSETLLPVLPLTVIIQTL